MTLPSSARIVVVGGGIVGCSTAYHLGAMGQDEVLLLERHKLSSGSTWHAAGLVGQLRTSANITQLLGYSVALYDRLEAETGLATGWKMNGGLRLACTPDRWTEVKRQATTARSFGLEMQLLTPKEAQDLWPLMQVDDVIGAAFLPTDGQASPSDLVQALARGARSHGSQIREDTAVTAILIENGRVTGVETTEGLVACEKLVLCAGQWTRELAAWPASTSPSSASSTSTSSPRRSTASPRPPDPPRPRPPHLLQGGGRRPRHGRLRAQPEALGRRGRPRGLRLPAPRNRLGPFRADHGARPRPRPGAPDTPGSSSSSTAPRASPPTATSSSARRPRSATSSSAPASTPSASPRGGGAGMALAEWVAKASPPTTSGPSTSAASAATTSSTPWVRTRTLEAYAKHYTMAWPSEEYASGRPLRRSPLYDRLKAKGAVFGEKLGWERPNWFAGPADEPRDIYSMQRPNWFEAVGREHRACREAAALFDQTSFAKFMLTGRDAEAALAWICAGDTSRPPGTLTYTQILNARGGIECDLTVARLTDDAYYIVTGTGFATHDFAWIARNFPQGADARLADVTSAYATLALMGPRRPAKSSPPSPTPTSRRQAFPFATVRRLSIAGAPVIALRITYVGELGWELHIPVEFAATVYDALAATGVTDAGYRAIETLRLEKGYRAWAAEIGPDHSPLMAGLGFATKLRSNIPFLGRDALEAQRTRPLPRILAGFAVADPAVTLLGRETIYRNGRRAGWLASAGWGYTLGMSLGYGYVRDPENGLRPEDVLAGSYELEVATERVPARVFLKPPYDPESVRIKA